MTANYANPDLVSYEIASAIVLKDGRAIQFLRPENYTNQQFTALAQLALIQSPDVLKYIRPKFQTKEVIAVRRAGRITAVSADPGTAAHSGK